MKANRRDRPCPSRQPAASHNPSVSNTDLSLHPSEAKARGDTHTQVSKGSRPPYWGGGGGVWEEPKKLFPRLFCYLIKKKAKRTSPHRLLKMGVTNPKTKPDRRPSCSILIVSPHRGPPPRCGARNSDPFNTAPTLP